LRIMTMGSLSIIASMDSVLSIGSAGSTLSIGNGVDETDET
jgi:hypothetical protein